MTAYIFAIRDTLTDADEMKTYASMAAKTMTPDAKVLASHGAFEVLEGDAAKGVVLLEFPDADAARAWYDSPAYQEAMVHRRASGDYRIILFDGR